MRLTLFVFLSYLGLDSTMAQVHSGDKADEVFDHLYRYEMLSADSIVAKYSKTEADSALWDLLSATVAWSEILAGNLEDEYWNKRFDDDISVAKRNLKRSDLSQNDRLFYYIIANAFKTRYELLNDNYFTAANDLNTCIDQITSSFGREEQYKPFYLTSGLYYYFMGEAHENYILMRPALMLYPKGDKQKGLSFLYELSTSSDVFLRNESNYFLMRIFYDLEEDYDRALIHARYLLKYSPSNLIYKLYYIKILQALNEGSSSYSAKLAAEKKSFITLANSLKELSAEQKEHFITELNADE